MSSHHSRHRPTPIPPHWLQQPTPNPTPSSRVAVNLRWGIGWGVKFATVFSVFVLLMALVRGSVEYSEYGGLTIGRIVLFYYAAGTMGGALLGFLRPVEKYYAGKLLTAYLLLFLVYGGGTAVFLPLWNNSDPHPVSLRVMLEVWAVLCLVLAPVYAQLFRRSTK